jgi:hypothetical protein
MTTERKFVEDKVYLQGPDGQIWDYDALLANQSGYVAVTPNKSKKAATQEEADKKAQEEADAAAQKLIEENAAKAAQQIEADRLAQDKKDQAARTESQKPVTK